MTEKFIPSNLYYYKGNELLFHCQNVPVSEADKLFEEATGIPAQHPSIGLCLQEKESKVA